MRRKSEQRIFGVIFLGLIAMGIWWLLPKSIPGAGILRGADRVEVFRVAPEPSVDGSIQKIAFYPILATGNEQGPEFARRLSKLLLGKGVTQNQKKCGLQPGVAYRVWNGDRAVEVLVCFKCDVLWPHVVSGSAKDAHLDWKDFDPIRADLVALTKEAFPKDPEIQALPERRK